MNKTKGFLALLCCGLIFGSFGVWIRLLSTELTSFQQIAFRNIIGFAICAGIILYAKPQISFKSISKIHLFFYSILFPIEVILYTIAILQTKIALTTFGLYIGSIISSLIIGAVIFKEKITVKKMIGILLLIGGLIFFSLPFSLKTLNIGLFMAILAGTLDTISNSFRKYLGGKIDRLVLTAIPMLGGLVIASGLMIFNHQQLLPTLSLNSWLIGIMFGFLLLSINYLMLVGFHNFDLNLGTIVISSELIFAPIFAILFFTEIPSTTEILGGVCVVLAIIVTNSDFLFKKR